jgi:uncharacterized membrane protein
MNSDFDEIVAAVPNESAAGPEAVVHLGRRPLLALLGVHPTSTPASSSLLGLDLGLPGISTKSDERVLMSGQDKMAAFREQAAALSDVAAQLARDKKLRKRLAEAAKHASRATRLAVRQVGTLSLVRRLASDAELRAELQQMADELEAAWDRLQDTRIRSHRLRNTLLLAGLAGGLGLALRKRGTSMPSFNGGTTTPSVLESAIEVAVPVSVAYNQWTQFEEFPQFMRGVDEVRQLDDTRLHWVASVGGRRAEWDAKILEQHPDRQISWISEDGKKNRGTVTFESLGEDRTLIRLTLSYQTEGFVEAVGSAAGLDRRRIEGDLVRFKELIEGRGRETGAWRQDVSAGTT